MKFSKPYTLAELADFLGATAIGASDFIVTGMNEIHTVEPGDITFVDHPKYYEKALNSAATTILINSSDVICPEGKALLISQDPFADFNKLTQKFRPFVASSKMISDSAEIGENTIIQPNVFIGNHVKIGKNCVVHSNVSIYDFSEIGDDCIIHSGVVIGADAYYFQRKPEGYRKFLSSGKVILENRVEVGANTCIDRGVSGDTIIGEGTKMDNFVQIGHDTIIGKNCLIGSHSAIAGVTKIEDDVVIWGQVVVNKDLVIGKGAVILATSAVDKTLEGGKSYFGMPAIEARKKWRELAALRNLPDLLTKIK
ncbi:MAG: UDP-3-O-(3-hydroxymyristoyl)glucosamine N-acyltransferase [Bacteroidales bacterium]|jgi:UDP-3-O-[3-hydroxymyristoyl] glucosamine N-acyltransferase|nr:UDP-3-O-(3-hydroxymyristoyl)glucosamine N-acyltransferase [Bacteroidales bacterium]